MGAFTKQEKRLLLRCSYISFHGRRKLKRQYMRDPGKNRYTWKLVMFSNIHLVQLGMFIYSKSYFHSSECDVEDSISAWISHVLPLNPSESGMYYYENTMRKL